MKNKSGIIYLILIIFITFNLWLLSKSSLAEIISDPTRSTSQILALLGLILMSISLILSTRLSFLENAFNGLDRMYIVHHFIGSIAFIFLVHHPILLALKSLPQISLAAIYLLPGDNFSYTLGVIALYFMIVSIVFIVFIKLPYQLWKLSHKLMGLSFLFSSLHVFFITSDVSTNLILRIWVWSFIIAGLISAFYIIFLYNSWGPKYVYEIEKVEAVSDILNISLKPLGRMLSFHPGQFVYISFKNEFVGVEHHPFSLSSSPDEKYIRLSIKKVGDYTHKLPLLERGEKVHVYGPYGKFGDWYEKKQNPMLFVAGGIGITPFLSMIKKNPPPFNKGIILFYCLKNKDEAVFLEEITAILKNNPFCKFIAWFSSENGRLNVKKIQEITGSFQNHLIQICGPQPMMESYKKQFMAQGIPEKNIRYESFAQL